MDKKTIGWINGGMGVLAFSGSLPATKVAVQAMSPLFLTSARAVIAAVLAAVCLIVFRAARPEKRDIVSLVLVACLLKEPIGWAVVVVMIAIVACVAGARRFAS